MSAELIFWISLLDLVRFRRIKPKNDEFMEGIKRLRSFDFFSREIPASGSRACFPVSEKKNKGKEKKISETFGVCSFSPPRKHEKSRPHSLEVCCGLSPTFFRDPFSDLD